MMVPFIDIEVFDPRVKGQRQHISDGNSQIPALWLVDDAMTKKQLCSQLSGGPAK